MKPASYQSVAPSVMSPNMTLGTLLTTPNLMRCEKCRFATTDITDFKKHMAREHIEYYCFYCNSVSLSEAELQAHLKIHTATSPFKCPHCGQVYMRRMCLIKHIERFHSQKIPQGSLKIDSTKTPYIAASSASPSVSNVQSNVQSNIQSIPESASQRPAVRVTVPTPNATGIRLDSNFQRLKSLNSYLSNVSHGDAVPLNGQVQRNRALTVPLPEEVSIPAGCMVEVAEVKTVDGTKELRLRFVAHQEKESVIKNGHAIPETSKVIPSLLKYPNTIAETEMRTIKNNDNLTNMVVKDHHPPRVSVSQSLLNSSLKEQSRTSKRPSSEVINLDADVPNKISRTFSPVVDSKVPTSIAPINLNVPSAVLSSKFASRIIKGNVQPENLSVRGCPRIVEERRSLQERPSISASIMTNSVQTPPRIMPINRGPVTLKANESILLQKNKQESSKPQQQSSKTQFFPLMSSVVAPPQIRVTSECKDKLGSKAFVPQHEASPKTSTEPLIPKNLAKTLNTLVKLSALPQEVKVENAPANGVQVEGEGFPVISSVYSLSRQPVEPRECSQPIVMAEWTNSGGRDGLNIKSVRSEQLKMTAGQQAPTETKDDSLSHDVLSKKVTCESVKAVPKTSEPLKAERNHCIAPKTSESVLAALNTSESVLAALNTSESVLAALNTSEPVQAAPNTSEPVQAAPNTSESVKAAPNTSESVKAAPNTSESVQAAPNTSESVKAERDHCIASKTSESVKAERAQCVTPKTSKCVKVKNEKSTPKKERTKCNVKKLRSPIIKPAPSLLSEPPLVSENSSLQDPETENSSKFLTVSLKRVQMGIWKKSKKRRKAAVSKSKSPVVTNGVQDCTVLQLMPLRKDQAVICPSPIQPVVVLNHPQPKVPLKRRTKSAYMKKAASLAPKCHILKMKLGKVTELSYKVIGCTVQNSV